MCSFTMVYPTTFALAVLLSQVVALPQASAPPPAMSTSSEVNSSTASPYSSSSSMYNNTSIPYHTSSSYPSSGSGCTCYSTPTPYPVGNGTSYSPTPTPYPSSNGTSYPSGNGTSYSSTPTPQPSNGTYPSGSCSCPSGSPSYSSQPSYTSSPYLPPTGSCPPTTTPYPTKPHSKPSSPNAPAPTLRATFDTTYDNKNGSLNSVACSNGANGLVARFPTFGDVPTFPFIGGAFDVVWNSPNCGGCWTLTNPATSVSINFTAVDAAGVGFNIAQEAFVRLNGGEIGQGVIDVVASKVSPSVCGL